MVQSSGRLQIRRSNTLRVGELPVEGEPFWDPIGRRIGFYNFEYNEINWFRIPGHGESETYIPRYEWDGTRLRWQNVDGTWGDWVNLQGTSVEDFQFTNNNDGTFSISYTIDGQDYTFTSDDFTGPPGPSGQPPLLVFTINDQGQLVFTASYDGVDPIEAHIDDDGNLVIVYGVA